MAHLRSSTPHGKRTAVISSGRPVPVGPALSELGVQIQGLRVRRALTLEELGRKAEISPGLLSQLERGLGNPSFSTLHKLAHALEVPLSTFFQGSGSQNGTVVRRHERKRLVLPNRQLVYELVTPDLNRAFEMVWVEFSPGASTEKHPYVHQGEECGLVLDGKLEVHLGDEVFTLERGDSITFQSTVPHWHRNPGTTRTRTVWAVVPPSF